MHLPATLKVKSEMDHRSPWTCLGDVHHLRGRQFTHRSGAWQAGRPLQTFASDDERCKLQAFRNGRHRFCFDVNGVTRGLGARGPVLEDF